MKILTLGFSFIKKNIVSTVLALILMLVSCFVLATFLGQYNLQVYCGEILADSGLDDDVFFMINPVIPIDIDPISKPEITENVEKMNGVKNVIYNSHRGTDYGDGGVNIFFFSDEMLSRIKFYTMKGSWLDADADETQFVIGGSIWDKSLKIGDMLTLSNGMSGRIVGIIGENVVYPHWGGASNEIKPAAYFFRIFDNVLYVNADSLDSEKYEKSYFHTSIIEFEDDCTSEERENITDYLLKNGFVYSIKEIVDYTHEYNKEWLVKYLPLPLFIITIVTINMISICVISVKKSMADTAKYYLTGCTKRRAVLSIGIVYAVVFSLPAIINVFMALYKPEFIRTMIFGHIPDYIFSVSCLMPIILYAFAMIVIMILIPIVMYRTYSPIKFYRQNL